MAVYLWRTSLPQADGYKLCGYTFSLFALTESIPWRKRIENIPSPFSSIIGSRSETKYRNKLQRDLLIKKKHTTVFLKKTAGLILIWWSVEVHADNPHKFIFQHYPLYLSDPAEAQDGSKNLPIREREMLLDYINRYHVKAHFSGHRHYEIENKFGDTLMLTCNPSARPLGNGQRGYYIVDYDLDTKTVKYRFVENTQQKLEAYLSEQNPENRSRQDVMQNACDRPVKVRMDNGISEN